jgi:hypothetical protein
MSSPLAFTDAQLSELKLAASTIPPEARGDFLKLIAGLIQLEGDEANAGGFDRALAFALDNLSRDVRCC